MRRALSSAVRAFGLHPKGRPFESDSAHHPCVLPFSGDVVQLVRTLPCHGRGREFESRRPRHSFQALTGRAPFSRGHKKAQNRYREWILSKQSLRFLRFFSEQERDHCLLRIAFFRCDRLRVSVECHANCRVAQQLLHDLQLRAGRSKQRRISVTKSMPSDSLRDCKFSRDRTDMVPHDLLGQVGPATLVYRARKYPALWRLIRRLAMPFT